MPVVQPTKECSLKLVVQIPCYNETQTLEATVAGIPRKIPGVDEVNILVIDDGSRDGTAELACHLGVDMVVRHRRNRGLAAAFRTGICAALRMGADIIVNTDGDNQYYGGDIPELIEPILNGTADIVIGDRQTDRHTEFSWTKRLLQRWGSRFVGWLGNVDIPDAVSGFRAISSDAAMGVVIHGRFSYTTELIIHSSYRGLAVVSVPIRTNRTTRPSRLFRSIPEFLLQSGMTMLRAYTMYHPLRVFLSFGLLFSVTGMIPILRFLILVLSGNGAGHIQSLVIGGTCLTMGVLCGMFGAVAELQANNRRLSEAIFEQLNRTKDAGTNPSANTVVQPHCGCCCGGEDRPQPIARQST